MLFFGHDDRKPVDRPASVPWEAIGQLETESGNLCSATLISAHLALTAGHCLVTPPAVWISQSPCALSPGTMAGVMKFTISKRA